jgi:hypothetical protein
VILKETMMIRRRVSSGDAAKMSLHVADQSTFPTTTDPLISIRAKLRDLPYFCMTVKSPSIADRCDGCFQRLNINLSGGDGERGMTAEVVRISKRGRQPDV